MARAAILREMGGVFGAYNIQVDRRHLELIADYMVRHHIGNFFRLGPTRDRHSKGGINHSIGRVSQITHRHCSRLLMRRRQHFSRTRRFMVTLTTSQRPQEISCSDDRMLLAQACLTSSCQCEVWTTDSKSRVIRMDRAWIRHT